MKTKLFIHFLLILCTTIILTSCHQSNTDLSNREINFDSGWKFKLGHIPHADSSVFDDSGWRDIDLPHDWSIEDLPVVAGKKQIGPFSEDSPGKGSTGHVMGGEAWYRKTFVTEKSFKNKIVQVCFDGVYMECNVWINGQHIGFHPYGYTPFQFNMTPYLKPVGEKNTISVVVINPGKNSRWYSGSGIYRHVNLLVTDLIRIPVFGVFISTPEVSNESAKVKVVTTTDNRTTEDVELTISTNIISPEGTAIASMESPLKTISGEITDSEQLIEIKTPSLWSPDSPKLYQAISEIKYKGKTIDRKTTNFGIRSIEFSAEKGFLLNGERVLLKGGCMHHDNGPLGSATIDRAEERRVELMKQFGFNAIRTSHNPPSTQFLDACDRLGVLVIDEAFDQWMKPKNPDDFSGYFYQYHQEMLEAMIMRDRNHPSVILWSIGNEIQERGDSSGIKIRKELMSIVKKKDTTRPVTEAICSFWDNPGKTWEYAQPALEQLDVAGYNYQWREYENDHKKYPNRTMIGTESIAKEAFENWQMVENNPYVLGDFIWTSMDYLGESGIGRSEIMNQDAKELSQPEWPWYNAFCGDIDICGFKKPQSYFRDVVWGISNLEIAVHAPIPAGMKEMISMWGWPDEQQSWNWQGNEGQKLSINVYSNYPEVRMELNGKVIGTKTISKDTKLTATFEIPYETGELKAVALNDGKEMETKILKTTGKPAKIRMIADRSEINASRNDLSYVTVEITDDAGNLVPDANIKVIFRSEGSGGLIAVENGDPRDMKSFQAKQVKSYRGKCLAIVRPSGIPGQIKLSAEAVGLSKAELVITTK
jgi:beta-galactosidase